MTDATQSGDLVGARIADGAKPVSLKSAYYSLFVLGVVVMFTVLDRQILSLLIVPVKADFGITDTQAALLIGAAFSLTYAIAGLPIARLADKYNRRNIIAASIAFWSAATVACGVAQNYAQIFAARLGIGAGESGYGPAAWSIVADSLPREKLAFGVGMLNIGAQVGTGLALFLGGWALSISHHLPVVELPFGGVIRNWQWAFFIVGLPGLLWGLVVLTIREPPRKGVQRKSLIPMKDIAIYMGKEWRAYLASIGGGCMKILLALGPTVWLPTMMYRKFDWQLSDIGLIVGAITLVIAPIGLVIGGKISERWTSQGTADANMRITLYALCASVPLNIAMPLLPDPRMVLVAYAAGLFISTLGSGPGLATTQLITPNSMRAQVGAVKQFSSNVLAYMLGPLIVALFTDYLFGSPDDLHLSMALSTAILGPLTILIVWQGMGPYRRAYDKMAGEF